MMTAVGELLLFAAKKKGGVNAFLGTHCNKVTRDAQHSSQVLVTTVHSNQFRVMALKVKLINVIAINNLMPSILPGAPLNRGTSDLSPVTQTFGSFHSGGLHQRKEM